MTGAEIAMALLSGAIIGSILGLIGGGGSILAVPLLLYLVGVSSIHMAIGTSAVAVAANAATGLIGHARAGNVKWRCAGVFAFASMVGAAMGAEAGKAIDGARLLGLFGVLMIVVGLSMLRKRRALEQPDVRLTRQSAAYLLPRLIPMGLAVGLASGFFGIGGGFLIVPALMAATGMPLRYAVGTSLVVVTGLGLTTATSYSLSGLVDWSLIAILALGGIFGAVAGIGSGKVLSGHKAVMERLFAAIVISVGVFVIFQSFWS